MELQSKYAHYINIYNALYQLKTENEEELNKFYNVIKTELIDSKKHLPQNIIRDILNIIPYNNRYTKSYLTLAKLITDEYHVTEVREISNISNFLFYKVYGIKLDKFADFGKNIYQSLDKHIKDKIYRAIMYNEKEKFISFTEKEGFNKDKELKSELYPESEKGYSLLELCCYHGAVDCFKLLRTKFNSEITERCLELSFLGRNQEIMMECLKFHKPNNECMKYAIISHNIDFVTYLMNEYKLKINTSFCAYYKNLSAFLVYFDKTYDINNCLNYSGQFDIPSLCEHFLSLGANVNTKNDNGETALHTAALKNYKETAEVLLSHGANINERDGSGETALHKAAKNNSKETAELLLSRGAHINEKCFIGETALHKATKNHSIETAELLILHGANINIKDKEGKTALHDAAYENNKEIAELLISHGAKINEKNKHGKAALHITAWKNSKETAEILILSYSL